MSKGHPWVSMMTLAAVVGMVVAVIGADVAWAKLPSFTIKVSTDRPQAGEPVRVVVRFWGDRAHSIPARWLDEEAQLREIPSLIGVYRTDPSGSGEWGFPITVRWKASATYEGQFTPMKVGSWVLVPFPHMARESIRGAYPETVEVHVTEGTEAIAQPGPEAVAAPEKTTSYPTSLGVVILILAGLGLLVFGRARRLRPTSLAD